MTASTDFRLVILSNSEGQHAVGISRERSGEVTLRYPPHSQPATFRVSGTNNRFVAGQVVFLMIEVDSRYMYLSKRGKKYILTDMPSDNSFGFQINNRNAKWGMNLSIDKGDITFYNGMSTDDISGVRLVSETTGVNMGDDLTVNRQTTTGTAANGTTFSRTTTTATGATGAVSTTQIPVIPPSASRGTGQPIVTIQPVPAPLTPASTWWWWLLIAVGVVIFIGLIIWGIWYASRPSSTVVEVAHPDVTPTNIPSQVTRAPVRT